MSRNTRSTRRRASQSPDRLDDIFDLTRSADDVHNELMQQALLEAIGGVPTPVSPTYHKFSPTSPTYSRRSHRSSIVPAAYDPARPNAESHDVPYDPAAWADATVISSDHGSRRSRASTPLFGRSAAHYSPSIPVFSPNSRPLRTSQEYDPLAPTPGYRYADRLPGRASWRQAPYVSDNELSPGYQPYEGHERAGNYRRTSARLERLARTLDRFATHVDSRMDRMEAQLGALYDALSEQADGPRGAGSASSGGRKRKRLSSTSSSPSKRVSFDTPDSDTSFEPSISDLFRPKKTTMTMTVLATMIVTTATTTVTRMVTRMVHHHRSQDVHQRRLRSARRPRKLLPTEAVQVLPGPHANQHPLALLHAPLPSRLVPTCPRRQQLPARAEQH
jgi:hypothetical protein